MGEIRGVICTVVTPFDDSDQVDEAVRRHEVRYLLDAEVDALCACGSTGEGHTLSVEESARVCEIVVEEARRHVPVIGGITQNSTARVSRYGTALKNVGVDALQITPVHYVFSPSPDGIVDYHARIGSEVDMPITVYSVVPWALIPADVVARIAEVPQVVGIKRSGRDMHLVADLVARLGVRISILAAVDDLLYPAFMLGADGVLAAIPTVVPHLTVELWNAVQQGNLARARILHERTLTVWRALEAPNPPARIKEVLRLQGRDGGRPSHPLTSASNSERALIKEPLSAAGVAA